MLFADSYRIRTYNETQYKSHATRKAIKLLGISRNSSGITHTHAHARTYTHAHHSKTDMWNHFIKR